MFPNTDTLLGPVLSGLVAVAAQVTGIGTVYTDPPEGPPEDNSVLFPVKEWNLVDWTDGTVQVAFTIDVTHVFRRERFQDDMAQAQTFIAPWLFALTDLSNTDLNGAATLTDVGKGRFIQYSHAGQVYLALVHTVTVTTEFVLQR